MTERTYAMWVEPIAERDRSGRTELIAYARAVPTDAWETPSEVPGWTCKDVLAHIAGDTGKWFSHMLHAALDGEQFDPKRAGPGVDMDAINARDVEERRDRTAAQLIAEIEADGEGHDELLSRLTDEHQDFRLADYMMTFGELLSGNPAGNHGGHDLEHLEQLRQALEVTA